MKVFKYGFHLFSVGQIRSYESPNLLSAAQQPQIVDQKLAKELEAHRLAGPFDVTPFPFHAQEYHLLGIKWKGHYYYDKCMPMGCSSSYKTFETFSTAIEWIAQDKLGIANLLHLLDDFLLIQPTESQCSKSLQFFLELCDFLGIPMAPEKTFGPSTILTFAGIELDTIRCESRLPEDKLLKCKQLIAVFIKKRKATLRELQSLIGVLNFAILEFYPIVFSLMLWGNQIKNRCITFFTDNEALVHVINKSTCKDTTLMVFVRKLVLDCLNHNILFKAKHISGFKNTLADALSRLKIHRSKELASASMDRMPT